MQGPKWCIASPGGPRRVQTYPGLGSTTRMPFYPDTGKPRTAIRGRANPHGSGSVETPLSKHLLSQEEQHACYHQGLEGAAAAPVGELGPCSRPPRSRERPGWPLTPSVERGAEPLRTTSAKLPFDKKENRFLASGTPVYEKPGPKWCIASPGGPRRVQTYPGLCSTTKMPFPSDTGKPHTARRGWANPHGSGSVETPLSKHLLSQVPPAGLSAVTNGPSIKQIAALTHNSSGEHFHCALFQLHGDLIRPRYVPERSAALNTMLFHRWRNTECREHHDALAAPVKVTAMLKLALSLGPRSLESFPQGPLTRNATSPALRAYAIR
ncbi:hypothetical protein ISCGN_003003 [Ixodes scapularis]